MGLTTYLLVVVLFSGINLQINADCDMEYRSRPYFGYSERYKYFYGYVAVCNDITIDEKNLTNIQIDTKNKFSRPLSLIIRNSYIPRVTQAIINQLYEMGFANINFDGNNITRIDANAFNNTRLTGLGELTFSKNQLTFIGEHTWDNLYIEKLDFSHNNLSKLEHVCNEKRSLLKLTANNNHIKTVNGTELNKCNLLQYLDLSNNYISSLNSVSEINSLRSLNLSYNLIIGSVYETDLQMPLTHLDLSNNQITHFDKNLLKNLTDLQYLYLRNNNLNEFLLLQKNKIIELNLSNNYLQSINCSFMQGKVIMAENYLSTICHFGENTTFINLSMNAIKSIETNSFSHLKKLMELILSRNLISEISTDAFKNLDNLYSLKLDNNAITDLNTGMFSELNSLNYLDLSSNGIKTLLVGTFTGVKRLETLDLSHNKIEYIYEHSFFPIRSIEQLYLHNNPLIKFEHNFISIDKLTINFAKISCKKLEAEIRGDKILPGDVIDKPNVHGIACEPNTEEENENTEHLSTGISEPSEQIRNVKVLFILIITLITILFISIVASCLHKLKKNKISLASNKECALNDIESNVN